jgi:hypothetical protein
MALGTTPTINLQIEKGADFYIPMHVETSLPAAISESDISGWTFLMTIRDTDSLASTYNQTVTPTITSAPANTLQAFITDTVNEALIVGVYKHDIWRTNADKEFCLGKGNYEVLTNRRVP